MHCTVVMHCIICMSQVCSVLESLEQEYKREEDWCGGADKLGPNSETDHVTPMISKHLEQKEAFLKVTKLFLFVFKKKTCLFCKPKDGHLYHCHDCDIFFCCTLFDFLTFRCE